MSRRNFGEDGTFVRWNLSRAFGVRTSSRNSSKRSASSRAPARRTPTRPLVATEALYAGVLLAEIQDAWGCLAPGSAAGNRLPSEESLRAPRQARSTARSPYSSSS